MKCKNSSKAAIIISVIALILSAVVSVLKVGLWLAGSQWMLIAIVSGVYAIYLGGCSCGCSCCADKKE